MRRAGLALVLFAVAAGLLAPLLTYPFGRDQGAFACVADVVRRGGVPYRDAWEMKPPGIFYVFWASFLLFGRSMLAPRLLDLLCTLATAAAVWALGRALLSPLAGGAGAFFFIIRYVAGQSFWNTTQCESFASLPLTLAAAALAAAEVGRKRWPAAACGLLIGVAILLKPTVGVFVLLGWVAALASPGEPLGARLARAGGYLLGCLAVAAVAAGAMWRAGALREMFETVVVWNAEYGSLNVLAPVLTNPAYQTVEFLAGGRHHLLLFPIGLLALIGAADLALRPEAARLRWLVPAWALTMMVPVWTQGKYYTYHWLPALPPVALLAGQGLRAVSFLLNRVARPWLARTLAAGGLAVLLGCLAAAYWTSLSTPVRYALGQMPRAAFLRAFDQYGGRDFSLRADREVAAFLARHTPPEAPIFIWGFEPLIYFLADRPPASRFIYHVPLVTEWSPPGWRRELLRDLARAGPAYVLVVHNDLLPWMTGRWDDSAGQLATYPELTHLLHTSYRFVRRIEDFDIWERR